MDNLDEEEAALLAQLEAIKLRKQEIARQKAEELKKLELTKPCKIIQMSFNGSNVLIKLDPPRNDVLDLLRAIPGRLYNAYNATNSIPVSSWIKFENDVALMEGVTLVIDDITERKINKHLFSANFEISITDRILKVETNSSAHTTNLHNIPGVDYKLDHYAVPLSEGWRLWDFVTHLPDTQTVVWTPQASEFVAKQVEGRIMLDKIALAKDWDIKVPDLKAKLKPFQNVGVAFFNNNGGSGILADEMGLGKTMQALALALLIKGKTIIVPPAALKINWIREIGKFTNERAYVLQGTTPTLYDMSMLLSKDCPRFVIINYDILAANTDHDQSYYTTDDGVTPVTKEEFDRNMRDGDMSHRYHKKIVNRFPWVEILNMMNADLLVYDEAHYIKNVGSSRSQASRLLQAKRTICLTGTPVLNRPGELWPMLHIIDPITFPVFERFLNQYSYDGKATRNIEELREVLKPIMIRRLKKDVYDELPPLNRIDEAYELSPRAKKLYQKALDGVYEIVATWNPSEAGNEKKIQNILVQIMRLKQIVAIDKVPATADLATRIYDSSDPSERPKKVLIFSQFKPTAYAIKVRLGDEAIGFVNRSASGEFVTANSVEQDRIVQEFQNDPKVHYLVVTEKTAKEGHNITEAMAVVFNDFFWTPAAHQQSEGRAYMRNNDPHGIDSYWHYAPETIDEWVLELLRAKLRIIEEVVDGVNNTRVDPDESIVKELIQRIKDGTWKK